MGFRPRALRHCLELTGQRKLGVAPFARAPGGEDGAHVQGVHGRRGADEDVEHERGDVGDPIRGLADSLFLHGPHQRLHLVVARHLRPGGHRAEVGGAGPYRGNRFGGRPERLQRVRDIVALDYRADDARGHGRQRAEQSRADLDHLHPHHRHGRRHVRHVADVRGHCAAVHREPGDGQENARHAAVPAPGEDPGGVVVPGAAAVG
mmetsp:Transcript_88154/g.269749  ORF Transcript_88154/g.269749 Transcript_88154/m.269749 type:complete len:206 (-) Transcript_88154:1400-2017(-)